MKIAPLLPVLMAALFCSAPDLRAAGDEPPMQAVVRESLDFAAAQYGRMLDQLENKPGFPRTVDKGELKLVRVNEWTCGFFPGSLWYLYEATGESKWREAAVRYTAGVEAAKDNRNSHDVGFMLYCSYGNGLRLTGDSRYCEVLRTGAESLSTRFNSTVGSLQSWNAMRGWTFPVIIDNMMNLELLLWAAREGGFPRGREIAVAHADTALRNHFRPDGSSYHVVDYDPKTGQILSRATYQGAADDSAWARGQAWGLYGYTVMFRAARDARYLAHAQKIAAFLMAHPRMPADKVPYWDFDAPEIPNAARDASAAALMSSALLELSALGDPDAGRGYVAFAEQQLRSLSSPAYRARLGESGCFLLMHSTGNHLRSAEIDVPFVYADYYFLEALLRCKARFGRED